MSRRQPMPTLLLLSVWALLPTLLSPIGCTRAGATADEAAPPVRAAAIGPAECGACGMVVREQPAPRGQLVHRDGTRMFFCSLGDLIQYQQAPSPHGKAKAVFVEVQPASVDVNKVAMLPKPWISAEKAHFVLGVRRRTIMGPPVLAFATAADASAAATRLLAEGHPAAAPLPWRALGPAVLRAADHPSGAQTPN